MNSVVTEPGTELPKLEKKIRALQVVTGAAATRDWQPIHHDTRIAEKSGLRGIIMNAPTQAGWISRYITDWTGPEARLVSMEFKMKDSICPGDTLTMSGSIKSSEGSDREGIKLEVEVTLSVEDKTKTIANVELLLPMGDYKPWKVTL
jgi:acyl dehydratase